MPSPFEALAEAFQKEAGRYRELARLGEEQKEILVAGRMADLPANVKNQEREIFALGPLADERKKAFESAALQLRLSKPTMAEVAAKCPAPFGDAIRSAARDAVEAAKSLELSNRGNEKLIANALAYVNFTLETLRGDGKKLPSSLRPTMPNTAPESQGKGSFNRVV